MIQIAPMNEDEQLVTQRLNCVKQLLEKLETRTRQLNASFQEIRLEQGYQGLTDQVLKKAIGLLCDVEKELVSVPAKEKSNFTDLNSAVDRTHIYIQRCENVVSGQSEVDDLLSSLGF